MEIVIDDVDHFRVFFDVVYDVSSDLLELQLFADRMSCSLLDGSRSCFYHVQYDSTFFKKYDVEIGSVTVFIEDIYKLLKLSNKTDVLTLRIDDEYLSAEIESENGNKRMIEFTMPSEFMESPRVPTLDADCVVQVNTAEMKQSVKDISLIATDIFQIAVDSGHLMYMCDTSNISDEFSSTKYVHDIEIDTGVSESLVSRYTLKFISNILKFEKISKTVELKIGNDYPLLYKFEDEGMGVSITGMIAPRMELGD